VQKVTKLSKIGLQQGHGPAAAAAALAAAAAVL